MDQKRFNKINKTLKWLELIACPIIIVGSIVAVYYNNHILAIYLLLWGVFVKIDRDIF